MWKAKSWALESRKQLKESGISVTIGIRNPSSTDYTNMELQNQEFRIHGVDSRIQDCLGFPYLGRGKPKGDILDKCAGSRRTFVGKNKQTIGIVTDGSCPLSNKVTRFGTEW